MSDTFTDNQLESTHVKKITDVRITSFFYTLGTWTIRVSDNSAQTISSHDKTIIIKFRYVAWYLNIMKYALLSIKRSSNTYADPELFFLGGGGGYFSLSGVVGGGGGSRHVFGNLYNVIYII